MNIDFSNYRTAFKDFCDKRGITFNSQEQADQYYYIWNAGFSFATYYYSQRQNR